MNIGNHVTLSSDFKNIIVHANLVPFEELDELIAILESVQYIKNSPDSHMFDMSCLYYIYNCIFILTKVSPGDMQYTRVYDKICPDRVGGMVRSIEIKGVAPKIINIYS